MLNFSEIGRPIAVIKGSKLDGKKIYVSDQDVEGIPNFRMLKLKDGCFQPIPDTAKERDCHYITGASGSGKSTWTRKFLNEYKKSKKKNPLYLFSSLDEDKNLDKKDIKRVNIGENLIKTPIQIDELANSAVIFDDTDVIRDKGLREIVNGIRDEILQIGRHHNITCLITNHSLTGKDLKTVLSECHTITFFNGNWNRQLKYLIDNYLGLNPEDIKRIRKSKSRWITVFKNYPMVILTENEVWLANQD